MTLRSPLLALLLAATAPAATTPLRTEPCTVRVPAGGDVAGVLAAATATPGRVVVCLDAGEHRLREFLAIERDGVRLRGDGPSTVLRLADGAQTPLVVIGDHHRRVPARPVSDVTVENLRLVGGGAGGDELHARFPYLTNSAVVVRGGRNVRLRHLDVSACRSACILTEHDTRDVTIEDTTVSGATWDGVSFNRTTRARLVRSTIRGNTAAGITAEHLTDSVIADNTIEDNRSHGIYLADSYGNRIRGNRFLRNTNAGVFLTCAVRFRDPGPVRCWDESMSAGNSFERNRFVANRRGYIVAADGAANCKRPGARPNRWRDDRFVATPPVEQDATLFGRCLEETAG